MMTEERKMILQMVQNGSITVEEAERLLEAIAKDNAAADSKDTHTIVPKRMVIKVTENENTKFHIRIPFSLLRVGLKLSKTITGISTKYSRSPEEAQEVVELLQSINLHELLDQINAGEIQLPYAVVDVKDMEKNQHVLVILE